jgi:uracil-DNA glycosylase
MKILFIGSNPSAAAKTYNPFCKSTKSGQILGEWISKSCPDEFHSACNISDNPTESNRPLTSKEIRDSLPRLLDKINTIRPDRIVTLGRTAERALTLLRFDFYAMPHPSGLNRQLNDPKFVEEKIKGLREYLSPVNNLN